MHSCIDFASGRTTALDHQTRNNAFMSVLTLLVYSGFSFWLLFLSVIVIVACYSELHRTFSLFLAETPQKEQLRSQKKSLGASRKTEEHFMFKSGNGLSRTGLRPGPDG